MQSERPSHLCSTGSWVSGDVMASRAVAALLLLTRGWNVTSSGYLRIIIARVSPCPDLQAPHHVRQPACMRRRRHMDNKQ